MYVIIENALDPVQLEFMDQFLAGAVFIDGRGTAGSSARGKRNLELDRQASPGAEEAERVVAGALSASGDLSDHALPRHVSRPIFSRYEDGMAYPRHVDNPMLGASALRTDVSVTLFLADPETYDGGELVLTIEGTERPVKLPKGWAVAYSTGTPHRVAPVTRGARLAAIQWIQSIIPDPHRRAIASDFHRLHHAMVARDPDSPETETFLRAYYNLIRLWSRP